MGYRRKILEARRISRKRKELIKTEEYLSFSRQCLEKVAYASERKVLLKISSIADEGRRGLRYYQCPFCSLFHISSHKIKDQKFVS